MRKLRLFQPGNSKAASMVFNETCSRWGTPKECPGCYDKKAYLQYPNVREYRQRTEKATLKDIILELSSMNKLPDSIRLYAGGNLKSQARVDMWKTVAREFPTIIFYGYCKENWDWSGAPINLRIRVNHEINYGALSWCKAKLKTSKKYYLCPCGLPGVDIQSICGNRCKLCHTLPVGRLPLFIKH